jgi:hypothetical protein
MAWHASSANIEEAEKASASKASSSGAAASRNLGGAQYRARNQIGDNGVMASKKISAAAAPASAAIIESNRRNIGAIGGSLAWRHENKRRKSAASRRWRWRHQASSKAAASNESKTDVMPASGEKLIKAAAQ